MDAILERFRAKYATITNALPPTTDNQFLKSKKRYLEKKVNSKKIEERYGE